MEEYKIKGWIARDKTRITTDLYLYQQKPKFNELFEGWDTSESAYMKLPSDWFPDLKYTDEPIEVELTIKATKP